MRQWFVYAAFLLGAFMVISVEAQAQIPTSGNVFVGYSYQSADLGYTRVNLNGLNASLEGKIFPFVGLVADFAGEYGSPGEFTSGACPALGCSFSTSNSFNQQTYLFGPRASFSVGKIRPFANFLVGVAHVNESGGGVKGSDTSFGYALGGGVDYSLNSPHQLPC